MDPTEAVTEQWRQAALDRDSEAQIGAFYDAFDAEIDAELSAEAGSFFADQLNNPDAARGYAQLAEELWEQSGKRVDAFVQSVGTTQCIRRAWLATRD
jgi:cysteine synthase